MRADESERPALEDPEARLERALIEEFLRRRGYDLASLSGLAEHERIALLREASIYAAARLTEVEARAHYVRELHGDH
jgi:capsular polysaccharide biosynthesis protein